MKKLVRVTARSYAKPEQRKEWRMPTFLRLVGLRNFLWLFFLAGIASFLHLRGTPHVLYEYRYFGDKDQKADCTYIGLKTQTIAATRGHCSLIRVLK